MPHHTTVKRTGEVTDIFAHRFVLKTANGRILADLGPEGAKSVKLVLGDNLQIEGEARPSEIKVQRVERGSEVFDLHDSRPEKAELDPTPALRTVVDLGYQVVGKPHRKPKHFEVLGRNGDVMMEFHISGSGQVRKTKPITSSDPGKWADEIRAAAADGAGSGRPSGT